MYTYTHTYIYTQTHVYIYIYIYALMIYHYQGPEAPSKLPRTPRSCRGRPGNSCFFCASAKGRILHAGAPVETRKIVLILVWP